MLVHQAYRFALDPTPDQEQALLSHCGAARFAFNWGLGRVRAGLAQREAERSYGVAEELLTPVPWSLYALRREWNRAKSEVAPWWRANSKESYNSGLDGLARALTGFTDSRRGRRRGKPMGFPRFKAKHRAVRSCRFTTGAMRLEADRRHVTLPRLGSIRSHESTRKLARRVEAGTARIVSATVAYRGGRWFVALTCQVQRTDRAPARPQQAVGVDVGVCALAVLSTGQTLPNPRHHTRALARLRRLNKQLARRQGPRGRDGERRAPSRRWQKTSTALARQHARVANARRDGLHKISTMLARRYGTVVVEDLNLAGMLKNRRLSRAIADLGLAELRRQLAYKTTWAGGQLVLADRFYPSSKTCSRCQTVKTKLSLGTRIFTCTQCGLVLDRDLNAAQNLAALAATVAQSCGETQNARRGAVRPGTRAGHAPTKREPPPTGGGTLPRQRDSSPIITT